jgi:hypothetical protein
VARPGALPAAGGVARYYPTTAPTALALLSFVLLLTPTGSLPSPAGAGGPGPPWPRRSSWCWWCRWRPGGSTRGCWWAVVRSTTAPWAVPAGRHLGGPGRLFAVREHVEVEATWGIYQRMIAAYREPDRARGRELMEQLITPVSQGVPATLTEVINGRLEHLRGSALGFRNLTNYIARSLLETGGFRPRLLHPGL